MLKEYKSGDLLIAGCDEAGRGCLAGPVYAAAVILPKGFRHPLLDDSKKMKEAHREELRTVITGAAIAWAVGSCDHEEIDRLNILNASFAAMHKAVSALSTMPGLLLIDGNRFRAFEGIPHKCVVGGDGIYSCIAAASVLAKTFRDEYMDKLHLEFPQYGWSRNKAYATAEHREAISRFGRSPYHRKSFQLKSQLDLGF
jgi:ribonuclease HII